jgi:hypothetical protein
MSIHVVAAILRVIFEDEEGRVVPERRVRNGFDGAANRKVIVGHRRLRRRSAGTRARRVIVAQPQKDEVRHGVFALFLFRNPALQMAQEDFDAHLVGHAQFEVRRFLGEVAHQFRLRCDVRGH